MELPRRKIGRPLRRKRPPEAVNERKPKRLSSQGLAWGGGGGGARPCCVAAGCPLVSPPRQKLQFTE